MKFGFKELIWNFDKVPFEYLLRAPIKSIIRILSPVSVLAIDFCMLAIDSHETMLFMNETRYSQKCFRRLDGRIQRYAA